MDLKSLMNSLQVRAYPSAVELTPSRQYQIDSLRINAVFLYENPCGKRIGIVRIQYGHDRLHNNRATIEHIVHDVNRAPAELHTVVQRLLLHVTAGKRRQQGRVNVQDEVGKGLQHHGAEDPHEAGQHDKPDIVRVQSLYQFLVESFALPAFRWEVKRPSSRAPARAPDLAQPRHC